MKILGMLAVYLARQDGVEVVECDEYNLGISLVDKR